MNYSAYVKRAKSIAKAAHAGQTDKAGEPYINHVSRVAKAVSDDPLAECVAWLHDVLEDCEGYDTVISDGFPFDVLVPLNIVTRWPWIKGDVVEFYYASIRGNPVALRVKLADIADNSDPSRLAKLDDKTADRLRKKYAKALRLLGVE